MKVTDFVAKDNSCHFNYFRNGVLYYTVKKVNAAEWFIFPVPVEDLAGATINNVEKSMFLMRYIRKALADNTIVAYHEG